jgi:hypothetical protein
MEVTISEKKPIVKINKTNHTNKNTRAPHPQKRTLPKDRPQKPLLQICIRFISPTFIQYKQPRIGKQHKTRSDKTQDLKPTIDRTVVHEHFARIP